MPSEPHTGDQNASPRSAADRIQPHSELLGQQNEGDDRGARQRADHQRKHEKNLIFMFLQSGAQT